jgi:alpha-amylase
MIWLPPAYKGASGGYSVGYDSYDLFDLGEFDQKGSIATKYGDKAQLLEAIDALKRNDIAVLLDVVVNHKMGPMKKSLSAFSA